MKQREIQCYDMRDHRLLRPFHCQAASPRPPARLPCSIQLCLDWYTSSWGQVRSFSHVLSFCLLPSTSSWWLWSSSDSACWAPLVPQSHLCPQCSELCGGGEQQRLVTCPEEGRCDEVQKPSYIQACNNQSCAQWVTGSWGQVSIESGPCFKNAIRFQTCWLRKALKATSWI